MPYPSVVLGNPPGPQAQLLDFEVALSLDGQPLTEAECREILNGRMG